MFTDTDDILNSSMINATIPMPSSVVTESVPGYNLNHNSFNANNSGIKTSTNHSYSTTISKFTWRYEVYVQNTKTESHDSR